jgi:hypothetical protein
MPIPTTLEQQFSSLSTDDKNLESPIKNTIIKSAAIVTPTKDDHDTNSFSSSEEDHVEDSVRMVVHKTEHKLKEERGELTPEPLLKENPHRFVIFPIQDNDVSISQEN